jgi:S-adenosylmethionine synthetase
VKIRVTTDLCQEALSPEESDIRPFSDDQTIVIGYACGDERTNYLPAAHWISGELGRRLFASARRRGSLRDLRTGFQDPCLLGGDAG